MKLFHTYMLVFILVMCSCQKDPLVEGCTDSKAYNYVSFADKDDGSCIYSGSFNIWWDEATADSMYADGHFYLIYYVSDQYWPEAYGLTTSFCESTNTCEDSCGFRRTIRFVGDQTTYRVKVDGSGPGFVIDEEFQVHKNQCSNVQVFYGQ